MAHFEQLAAQARIPPGAQCKPWCAEACDALNGDVALECGACTGEEAARCHPSAAGFGQVKEDVEAVGPWEIFTSAEARASTVEPPPFAAAAPAPAPALS